MKLQEEAFREAKLALKEASKKIESFDNIFDCILAKAKVMAEGDAS